MERVVIGPVVPLEVFRRHADAGDHLTAAGERELARSIVAFLCATDDEED